MNSHKHSRNLSPQCHSLYKSHLSASAEPSLCCFWASTIGSDIIWYIFDHSLKHSPVSSGNRRRNDSGSTISHCTSKGLSVTDAQTPSARKAGKSWKFSGLLQLFWRTFVPSTRNAASSRIRVLPLWEKVICRIRKRKGDGTEKYFAGKMFA